MILDRIVADKRVEVANAKERNALADLLDRVERAPATRDLASALSRPQIALIAEIKRASPSSGDIRPMADAAQIAYGYSRGGAAAVSVLTDRKYFRGDPESIVAARSACQRPLLRKDFIIDEYQIYESRALGADAVLLIVRVLDDAQLRCFRVLAESLGMQALVEVHDEWELDRAMRTGVRILGINNRNLEDFSVDLSTTERLAPLAGPGTIKVSESGLRSRADVERVARAGVDAVLIGEALMREGDPEGKVREFVGVGRVRGRVP